MADLKKESILETIKLSLGLQKDYTPFDGELLIHINSVVATLRQLGIGSELGVMVDASTTWESILEDDPTNDLENVRLYMFIKIKMIFDSNSMAAHQISLYERMASEFEWRITMAANPAPDISENVET